MKFTQIDHLRHLMVININKNSNNKRRSFTLICVFRVLVYSSCGTVALMVLVMFLIGAD